VFPSKSFAAFYFFIHQLNSFFMKKLCLAASAVASMLFFSANVVAQEKPVPAVVKPAAEAKPVAVAVPAATPKVEAAMAQGKTVADVAIASKSHTTLVAALKGAGLVDALKGKGPYTLFAPTNEAFAKIPADVLEGLLKPEGKDALAKILTNHVVSGNYKSADILGAIKSGNGKAEFPTLGGDKLTITSEGGKVKVTDGAGNVAYISAADLAADNGVVHVLDAVIGK
jgi:uncharacterized surface protein with fasciclin (FAS1) repeats